MGHTKVKACKSYLQVNRNFLIFLLHRCAMGRMPVRLSGPSDDGISLSELTTELVQ